MNTLSLELLFLVILIFFSAFFSASETGIMAINRYRLRHLARAEHPAAKQVNKLLEHPDRLLGVILIGNTFANIAASAVVTVIASRLFGDIGVVIGSIVLTIILLIFAEITPKTFAANNSQKTAFLVVYPLSVLLKILYPMVWFANLITSGIFKLCGIKKDKKTHDPLNADELQTVLKEATGNIRPEPQDMLLRVLDLEKVKVEEVMVLRNEIAGVNLDDEWDTIKSQLLYPQHSSLFLYHQDINNTVGVVNIRKILQPLALGQLTKEFLMDKASEAPYFVPEGTALSTQLLNFKEQKQRVALVVDEYGDIQGLISLEDILEEIVGEFSLVTHEQQAKEQEIYPQADGSYIIVGGASIREINRELDWNLSAEDANTLSGLIIEYLESIPKPGLGVRINGYPMEVIEVKDNIVKSARIYPALWRCPLAQEKTSKEE